MALTSSLHSAQRGQDVCGVSVLLWLSEKLRLLLHNFGS